MNNLKPIKIALFFLVLFFQNAVLAKDSALIIFDGSGSMWGQIEGKHKIEIAREVMGTLVKDWNEDIDLGLMAYGHREKGNCADIEVLFPVGTPDSKKILNIINKLSPKGKTPISQSLKQAADTLRYTEDPATVILISDGEETCNADPCAVSKELEAKGINFTAHVIGFDVKGNEKAREQLQCIAENTGGQFYEAENAGELSEAIVQVQKEVEDPRPTLCKQYAEEAVKQERTNIEKECGLTGEHWHDDVDEHYGWCVGQAIGSGLSDQELQKRIGELKACDQPKEKVVTNEPGKLIFNWSGNDRWAIYRGDQEVKRYGGKAQQVLQSGSYTIRPVNYGVFEPFEVVIKAGETKTVDLVEGKLIFNWSGNDRWAIYRGDQEVKRYGGKAQQVLQSGSYTIRPVNYGVFEPFEVVIKAGETKTVDLVEGKLIFNWSGNDRWAIYRGDQEVKRYGGKAQQVLQSGSYTIRPVNYGVFEPFEVVIKAGETKTIDLVEGKLIFNWSGNDRWAIYRGDQEIKRYGGKAQQVLQSGSYTIRPVNDPVFEPFDVMIKEGEILTINK